MPNQHPRIYLCVEAIIYNIVCLSVWYLRKFKGCSIIKFRNTALFPIATDLYLLRIYLIGCTKPSFCYP